MEESVLDRLGRIAVFVVVAFGLATMLAPIVINVVVSVSDSFVFPPRGFTLQWYENFIRRPEFFAGLRTSALLAAVTIPVGLAMGTGIAYVLSRRTFRGHALLSFLFVAPITMPRVAIGIAVFLFFEVVINVRGAFLRLVVLHVLLIVPYVTTAVTASLRGLDPRFEEAAMNLGASPVEAFRRVTLPLIRPGVLAAAIFAFVVSFDEVTASVFVTDARTTTFPVVLFAYVARGVQDPTVAAASTFMLGLVAVATLILARTIGLGGALGITRR